jgi:hypothetical protein
VKRVQTFGNDVEAQHAAGLLQQRGIPCEVRGSTMSEEPPLMSELWVLRDSDLHPAVEALRERPNANGPAWECSKCRTRNEPAFDACWSCGERRA